MSNFRDMALHGSGMAVRKNFKLLKYEHIIYHFKARGLEISNIYNYFREILKFRDFYEHFKKFREICFCLFFAKFEYFAKVIIYSKSPDHVL